MSDEVDDLLRRAMATLDHQAPSGYFDTLADRTLARLDGPALAELPAGSASEPPGDDPGLKIMRTADAAAPRDAPAADAAVGPPGPRPRARRAPLVAAIAVGLAAAAVAVIFVSVRDKDVSAPMAMREEALQQAERSRAFSQEEVTATTKSSPAAPRKLGASANAIAVDPAEQAARAGAGYTGPPGAAAGSGEVRSRADEVTGPIGRMANEKDGTAGAGQQRVVTKGAQDPVGKPTGKAPSKFVGKASGAGSGGAALDRKPPSSTDIKRAMDAVAGQVRACFDGTPVPGVVRLSVAPMGRIQEVTMTGPLAGTPAGTCVEGVVRTARFPPWDGPPQSVDFSYRISE